MFHYRDAMRDRQAVEAVLQHLARKGHLIYVYGNPQFLDGTDKKQHMIKLNKRVPCLKTLPTTFGLYESFNKAHVKIFVDDHDRVANPNDLDKIIKNTYFRDAQRKLLSGVFFC